MEEFEGQGGVSFLLIHFTMRNDMYYMPFVELKKYIERVKEGHPKNFKYVELADEYFLKPSGSAVVNYLQGLALDLESRDE